MIPVLKAYLPTSEELLPYLREIDLNNTYSNFGPLAYKLTEKISKFYQLDVHSSLLTSSATSALQACILYYLSKSNKKSIKVVTSAWSFPATVQSIISTGQSAYLLDPDSTGYITPSLVYEYLDTGAEVDLVMPVIRFGVSVDMQAWDLFTSKTGIPVLVDAAACFFSLKPSKTLSVVSLHATKGFSCGEGGVIVSTDSSLTQAIAPFINFGFENKRLASSFGINSKMSEFTAAVGLADYEKLERKNNHLLQLYDNYCNVIDSHGVEGVKIFSDRNCRTTFNIYIDNLNPDTSMYLISHMASTFGIEIRSWWGKPIFQQPISKYCHLCFPLETYQISQDLSCSVIGLPFGFHLTQSTQVQIILSLKTLLASI